MSDIWKECARVNVVELGVTPPRPQWNGAVPHCDEACAHHDGKRCALLGLCAPAYCEPVIAEMGRMLESLGTRLTTAEEARDAARADARTLAHVWRDATRPPPGVVTRALAYPEKEET